MGAGTQHICTGAGTLHIYAGVQAAHVGGREPALHSGLLQQAWGPSAPLLPSSGAPQEEPYPAEITQATLRCHSLQCSHMVSVVGTWHQALFFFLLFRISSLQLVLRTLRFSQSLPDDPGSSSPQLCALHLQATPVRSCVPLSVPARNWISSGTDTWPLHPALAWEGKVGVVIGKCLRVVASVVQVIQRSESLRMIVKAVYLFRLMCNDIS